jgi:hypothetical protein
VTALQAAFLLGKTLIRHAATLVAGVKRERDVNWSSSSGRVDELSLSAASLAQRCKCRISALINPAMGRITTKHATAGQLL